MNKKKLTTLLHIINTDGNIKRLLRDGLTFKKITELIEESVNQEFLFYDNEKITLTTKGKEFLEKSANLIKKQNKKEWIEKDEKSRIDKKDKSFIFIPRQNELTF